MLVVTGTHKFFFAVIDHTHLLVIRESISSYCIFFLFISLRILMHVKLDSYKEKEEEEELYSDVNYITLDEPSELNFRIKFQVCEYLLAISLVYSRRQNKVPERLSHD